MPNVTSQEQITTSSTFAQYEGLSEAQIRRLSMPNGFDYTKRDRSNHTQAPTDAAETRGNAIGEGNFKQMGNGAMEDSFYDNNDARYCGTSGLAM